MLFNSLTAATSSSTQTSFSNNTNAGNHGNSIFLNMPSLISSNNSSSLIATGLNGQMPKWAVMHPQPQPLSSAQPPPLQSHPHHQIQQRSTVCLNHVAQMMLKTSAAAAANAVKESEDHFDRHLDTLTYTDTFRPDEGPEELNASHVSKLMDLTKNRRRAVTTQATTTTTATSMNGVTKNISNVRETPVLVLPALQPQQHQQLQQQNRSTILATPAASATAMPTPLACSRSSSLTSLSSFDAKSVHSSVASEYSTFVISLPSQRLKSSSTSSSNKDANCNNNNRFV